jgi:hypothetical protein
MQWWRARTVPLLTAAALLCAVALVFKANAINMVRWPGFLCYCALAAALFFGAFIYLFVTWRSEKHYQLRQHLPWPSRVLSATVNMLMALLFLGGAAEAAARAFPAYTSLAIDPGIAYFWPEWFEARNSLGYADREPGVKRGPRVLLIGDSFTEGAGVRRHERFSNHLEQMLERDNPTIEVFNAGHCGFDTWREADELEKTGDAIRPDVVVVNYVLNDAEGEIPPCQQVGRLDEFLTRRLGSYAFFRLMITKHNYSWGASNVSWWTVLQGQHAEDGPGWRRVCGGMDRIEARHGLDDFGGRWPALTCSPYDAHPGAEAHHIMAVKLHEFLGSVVQSYRAPSGPPIVTAGLKSRGVTVPEERR